MLVLGLKPKPFNHIAVVEFEGQIGPRIKAGDYVKLLRSIEENDRIKSVVLDIDSPGGSATASNYLHLAAQELAKRKPVVAFIRGLGASGAYLFACPAARIVAIPGSLVGSIGVISMHPLLHEALGRVGVRMETTKSAELKDIGSMFREPTDEERAKEQELVDDLYGQFIAAVAEGRHLTEAQVRAAATGEVFTGRKAKELGLVDELGNLERALDLAAELGNVTRHPVWMKPRRGLRDLLPGAVASMLVGEIAAAVEERISARYLFQYRP